MGCGWGLGLDMIRVKSAGSPIPEPNREEARGREGPKLEQARDEAALLVASGLGLGLR